mmetsp:Transcript_39510/g.65519  ORF Transcript_39510/g.65519 Transcript_39510/m.65519 type:complete len:159 (-) Transcript_39510:848-1324(-)
MDLKGCGIGARHMHIAQTTQGSHSPTEARQTHMDCGLATHNSFRATANEERGLPHKFPHPILCCVGMYKHMSPCAYRAASCHFITSPPLPEVRFLEAALSDHRPLDSVQLILTLIGDEALPTLVLLERLHDLRPAAHYKRPVLHDRLPERRANQQHHA